MKTALLFSGQGSQTVGMGRDLCEKYEVCRHLFTHANEVLGRDLQKICFEGPVDVLTKTDNAQPGIFLTSLACLEALKCQAPDLAFDATAGLSLGEFTALAAADAVSFDDASNNRALISGKSALIFNPPSAWAVAKRDAPEVAADCWTFPAPKGPKGRYLPLGAFSWGIWNFSPNKTAAKELIEFLCQREQVEARANVVMGYDVPPFASMTDFKI